MGLWLAGSAPGAVLLGVAVSGCRWVRGQSFKLTGINAG